MNRIKLPHLVLLASLLGLLSGCVLPGVDLVPTPFPPEYFPTVVVQTAQAAMATNLAGTPSATPTQTLPPTETPTPTDTPTPIPTDTLTPSPSAPSAQIRILSPGPMSKVTSPMTLRIQIVSGGSELVQVDLQGEDGRLLSRNLERVPSWPGGYYFPLKVPFEVRAAAEVGRITISTKDGFGRIQSQLGMRVLLLSVGSAEINPEGDPSERAVFYEPPREDAIAQDGVLTVEGRFLPFNDQPVVLELLAPGGKPVGLRVLDFIGTDEQLFSTTIPYKVTEPIQALLMLRQDDDRLDGQIYVYSQEILLNP
ncbi:MAG: hypothetical protein JW963_04755 [Anaerolineales bacterium]|nr:hypothetical protein [Anaerolineales bacterium]